MLRFLLSFWLSASVVCSVSAQEAMASGVRLEHYGLDEGLPHRVNLSTAYDRDSMLWLTTGSALCRYDGYEFTSYPQLREKFYGIVRRGDSTQLYCIPFNFGSRVSARDSVEVFDPDRKTSYGVRLSYDSLGTYAGIAHRHGEALYFAQGAGVYRFRPGRDALRVHTLRQELQPGDQLIHATEDRCFILRAAGNRLEERLPSGDLLYTQLPPLALQPILHVDRNGRFWVTTVDQLMYKPPGTTTLLPGPALPNRPAANRIYEDMQGQLIFAHYQIDTLRTKSLYSFIGDTVTSLDWLLERENRLVDISGSDFTRELNVSSFGGFNRVIFPSENTSKFRRYLYDAEVGPGSFGHVMRGFVADDSGNVYAHKDTRQPYWFRVTYPGLALDTLVMEDGTGSVADHYGCGTNLINHNGDIYGSSCYVGEKDTAHIYRYRPADDSWMRWELPSYDQRIRWLMKTAEPGRLLLFTQSENNRDGEIYHFFTEGGRYERVFTTGPAYGILGSPKSVRFDSVRQLIWLATTGGLQAYDPVTSSLHTYDLGDSPGQFSDIVFRQDGTLLLGTFEKGLLSFDPSSGEFSEVGGISSTAGGYRPQDFIVLPSNDIATLRTTPEDYLLVATFNGLFVNDGTGPGNTFTTVDGLPSNEFNTPSLYRNAADNRWYAGGINGFVSFRVQDLTREDSPYEPLLLRVRYLDEGVDYEQTLPLLTHRNDPLIIAPSVAYFYIDFTLPEYSPKRPRMYQTRLVGLDDNWRAATETPSVRYTRLPAGQYTFQLRAVDGDGRQTEAIRELRIRVDKPWYRTGWFYVLSALTIIGLVSLLAWRRDQRIRREYQARRQIQDLELKTLRQQLNPHFISNAMNAIRDVVYARDPQLAGEYLTDFSRLMRLFLEASRKRFTTIRNETDLLRRYIRLEQLRFPDTFTFQINVDPEIEPDMDEVPSLILQPIVENAINHGLYHKESPGHLTINIALDPEDEDTILVVVTDDGVGRKAAANRASAAAPQHVSRSTDILSDRKELLAQDGAVTLSISVADLHDDREDTGTVVTVRIEPTEAKV